TATEKSEREQCMVEPVAATETGFAPAVAQKTERIPATSTANPEPPPGVTGGLVDLHPAEVELLRALDRAESTPGWSFVSLKKFRDEILPSENLPSIRSDVERQNVLCSAIDKRLILRKPVPTAKSSQSPV